MSRFPSPSVWTRLPGPTLLITCLASLVLAPPASAGIDPFKKAKEKIGKSAEQKAVPQASADEQVVFDDVVVELNNGRIEAILASLKKAGEAGAGRPALVEKLNKTNEERSKHAEKHWESIQAVRNKRSEVEVCYHDGYQAAQDRRVEEYKQRALTDPKLLEKYARVAQENNAAAARGDSAAIQRINAAAMEEYLPTREDSLKVRQSCGPIPPRTPAEDRLDALEKEVASLEEQVRKVDEKVAEALAGQSGLNRQQWGMALERIQMYLWAVGPKGSSPPQALRGFSKTELDALEKHLEELRGALG